MAARKKEGEPTFEELLAGVEAVIKSLQEGSLPLEEALDAYEKGFGMLKSAQDRLAAARERLEILRKSTDSEPGA